MLQNAGSDCGSGTEILDHDESSIRRSTNWLRHRGPSLIRASRNTLVNTKLSRLLALPPFIVAGMTPSTTHWDFVATNMRAGYHIELAGGGYRDAQGMTSALNSCVRVYCHPGPEAYRIQAVFCRVNSASSRYRQKGPRVPHYPTVG